MQTTHRLNLKVSRALWLTSTALVLAGLSLAFAPISRVAALPNSFKEQLVSVTPDNFRRNVADWLEVRPGKVSESDLISNRRNLENAFELHRFAPTKPSAPGAVITVTTTSQGVNNDGQCSLQEAIFSANFDNNIAINPANLNGPPITTGCTAGSGADTIVLQAGAVYQVSATTDDQFSVPGLTANPRVFTQITIEGNGARLELTGMLNLRAFTVSSADVITVGGVNYSGTGNLTIRDLHIKGFKAKGGDGADGGGGGLGAGGAIYVNGGAPSLDDPMVPNTTPSLTIERCTFESNSATGGNGAVAGGGGGGGGGGGLGGNAGNGSSNAGGGGGGSRGNGGSAQSSTTPLAGGGGGGTALNGVSGVSGIGGNGGFNCGGRGGYTQPPPMGESINGTSGFCAGGGGGGGAQNTSSGAGSAGNGGAGNYGGGGGGGGAAAALGNTNGGIGGQGGFGGGGGRGATGNGTGIHGAGGNGGFGGGGGGSRVTAGTGGLLGGNGGAGDGANIQNGGGGAGLGSAIFNDSGSVVIRNSTFTGNTAIFGSAGGANATGGQRRGVIFSRNGTLRIFNSTISNNASGFDVVPFADGANIVFELRNTIIADNLNATRNCQIQKVNGGSATKSGTGNLIESNGLDDPGGESCAGVATTVNPALAALTLNPPGLTPTMAITNTSSAFNAADGGTSLATDQRSVTRPQIGGFDIGAYELACGAVTCPANITQANDPNQCGAVVTYTPPASSACTVTCTPQSGSFFPVGLTTVTCTPTTGASCSFTVTVQDTQAPTITCPPNQTRSNDPNQCSAVVTYPPPTASDNCPGVTVSCSPASGSTFQIGTTTVTCTATDASPNSPNSTCTFTVRVNDTQPPTITCPANIAVGTTGNSAVVTYPPPTASDNCPGVTVACTPPSGSSFNVGVSTVTCTATDASSNTATCSFTVTVNRVSHSLSDPLACTGPGNAITGTFSVTNNGNAAVNVTASVTTPATLPLVPGTCATNVGVCAVITPNLLNFVATLAPGQTATVTYTAQIGDQVLPGTTLTSSLAVQFNGGPVLTVNSSVTVNCPAVGPGTLPSSSSPMSDQKAGSVLIYNIYTSGATSGNTQNTRINVTNTHPVLPAFVHLFFVAEGCSVADSYICLTGNQTASFLASDLDPGTTGYVVAIAVNAIGCPIDFNYLIGDEYVKFTSGHAANLGAEAVSAIAGGLTFCNENSVTAVLFFDGFSYNVLPRVLALDNVGSRADGNDTLLIVNRLSGNLGIGAATLSTLFGIFYDDAENALSYSFTGSCQLRSSISNNFPRLAPRFETFIPAGRTGWTKFWSQSDFAISGSAINFNPNAASSAGAFNQGHNLHILTNTSSGFFIIPLFPPSC